MMKRVFWFCPENDIALGRGCDRFTPPRRAALLARYGAPLMWWMGDEGDYVLVPEPDDAAYSREFARWEAGVTERFGQGPRFVTSLDGLDVEEPVPWGWSEYTIGQMLKAGASSSLFASVEKRVNDIRQLSHRRSAGLINEALARSVDFGSHGQPVPQSALEAFDADEISRFVAANGMFYVKSPWSSSGRGVFRSDSAPIAKVLERCNGIIRSQGSVMLEPACDKVADFAMLFSSDGTGTVRFHGYSRFFNSRDTSYGGNLIATDNEILAEISAMLPAPLLHNVRDSLEHILGGLVATTYRGLLGIDMIVARNPAVHRLSSARYMLVPCVELNLRMTMGHVAHAIHSRTLCHGTMKTAPATFAAGAIFNLVPVNAHFNIGFHNR